MTARKWFRGCRGDRRGQALAEFAIIMPLVLLFIAAIIEMGRAWNIKQVVTDAAREGARYAVVQNVAVDSNFVKARIMERLALAHIETATITIGPPGNWRVTDQPINVSVSTQHRMGLIGTLMGWAGAPAMVDITTNATMRNEPN
jgi:Flp pilus assembly protein TadG